MGFANVRAGTRLVLEYPFHLVLPQVLRVYSKPPLYGVEMFSALDEVLFLILTAHCFFGGSLVPTVVHSDCGRWFQL